MAVATRAEATMGALMAAQKAEEKVEAAVMVGVALMGRLAAATQAALLG